MTPRELQQWLKDEGYDVGPIDGVLGIKSLTALEAALRKCWPQAAVPIITPSMNIVVPDEWMPAATMIGIIFHWTAGTWDASGLDKDHYHILLEDDAKLVRGKHSIKANEVVRPPNYAAHTLGTNTKYIGVGLCGMNGAIERPFYAGKYPITRVQWDGLSQVLAQLCRRYSIPVTPRTVLSHAEVEANLGNKQKGKWDIAMLPFDQAFNTAKLCGDNMRQMVAELLK